MNKTIFKACATFVCCTLASTMLAGCSGTQPAPLTAEEQKSWKGSAPPAGFEAKMKEQQRKQLEKSGAAGAKIP